MALDLSALTNPYGQELAGIERNRALATALMQGGQQQPQGQMISGRYVAPSFAQQLNPLIQTLAGAYGQSQADTKQTQLANTIQQKQAEILRGYSQATTPQEKFALGTNPYAPAALQAATWDKLKTQKIGADETLLEGGIGGYTPSFTGPSALPPDVKYAASVLGLPQDQTKWTTQDRARIEQTVLKKSTAGANSFNFSNLLGKGVIGEVGPILKESKASAIGAVEQANAANRVLNGLNTDKAYTNLGANQKLAINQLGQLVGATGKNAEEQANATRDVIQGLAQLTLTGRKQMKGQGAVTESEGKLAERAIGGDINLTVGQIRSLADAAKRSAKFTYEQHEGMVNALEKDQPNVVPYYRVQGNTNVFEPIATPNAGSSTPSLGTALDIIRRTPTGAK